MKLQCQKKPARKLPFCEALFGHKYWKSTCVALVVTCLCQQTGTNVFNMYSNRIVTQLNAGVPTDSKIEANVATQILGLCSSSSALTGFWSVQKFKRRSLFIAGQITISMSLAFVALFTYLNNGIACMIFMCAFVISYQTTM